VSPLLWALAGAPRLLLPAALWERLNDEQRDTLLAHELAHLRRRDHWVRRLELLALGLYWWLPVAWWARRELQEAEELCCDAWVVWALPSSAAAYAEALLATVAFLSRPRPALPLGASGAGRVYPVKRRLTMILCGTCPRALSWPGFLALLALAAVLLPFGPTWARPALDPEPAERPAESEPKERTADRDPPAKPARAGEDRAGAEALRQARDEVELLEAQLDVRRAELGEVEARVKQVKRRLAQVEAVAVAGTISERELQKARDEAELLPAQLGPKQAQVREAETRLRQARRRLEGLQPARQGAGDPNRLATFAERLFDSRRKDFGEVSRGTVLTHSFRVVNRTNRPVRIATVRVSCGCATARALQTEVAPGQETGVEVQVDTRRFTGAKDVGVYVQFDLPRPEEVRLTVRADSRDGVEPPAGEERARLLELEKKLDALRKEIESLRRELKPREGAPARLDGDASDVSSINQRNFQIPFRLDPAVANVRRVLLYYSPDQGDSWHRAAVASPVEHLFTFVAPRDGLYWFAVVVEDTDGKHTPPEPGQAVGLKVRVTSRG
jgi:hypothetical protein